MILDPNARSERGVGVAKARRSNLSFFLIKHGTILHNVVQSFKQGALPKSQAKAWHGATLHACWLEPCIKPSLTIYV